MLLVYRSKRVPGNPEHMQSWAVHRHCGKLLLPLSHRLQNKRGSDHVLGWVRGRWSMGESVCVSSWVSAWLWVVFMWAHLPDQTSVFEYMDTFCEKGVQFVPNLQRQIGDKDHFPMGKRGRRTQAFKSFLLFGTIGVLHKHLKDLLFWLKVIFIRPLRVFKLMNQTHQKNCLQSPV